MFHRQKFEAPKNFLKIFGILHGRKELENLLAHIKKYDFMSESISLLIPCNEDEIRPLPTTTSSQATSLKLGGVLEELRNVTLHSNEKIGHFIVTGPLSEIITEALTQQSLDDFLQYCGIPVHETKGYANFVQQKKLLVIIQTTDSYQLHQARSLLKTNGAYQICTKNQTIQTPFAFSPEFFSY